MPLIGLRNELDKGDLVIIPVPKLPVITTWHLVWLKDKNFSPVAKAYLEYIAQEKKTIIEEEFAWYEDQH